MENNLFNNDRIYVMSQFYLNSPMFYVKPFRPF